MKFPIKHRFDGSVVRTVSGNDGEPWFCIADVSQALGIKNPRDFVGSQWCDSKGVENFDTPTAGGTQAISFMSERNLYAFVSRSNKPEARAFMDWVFAEVLPSIRKTGSYHIGDADKMADADPVLAVTDAIATIRREQLEQAKQIKSIQAQIESKPRISALPAGPQSDEMSYREKCQVGIRELVSVSGWTFQHAWRKVYSEYATRSHTNITVKAESMKLDKIEWIDRFGNISLLYSIIARMVETAKRENQAA